MAAGYCTRLYLLVTGHTRTHEMLLPNTHSSKVKSLKGPELKTKKLKREIKKM